MPCKDHPAHDALDVCLQAFIGTSPLVTLQAKDLHAKHLRGALPQLPLQQGFTCSTLRV